MTVSTVLVTLANTIASNFRATVSESGDSFLILEGRTVNGDKPVRLKLEETKAKKPDTVAFSVTSAPPGLLHREAMGLDVVDFAGTLAVDESRSRIAGKADTVWERMSNGYKGATSAVDDYAAHLALAGDAEGFAQRTAETVAALVGATIAAGDTSGKVVRSDGQTLDVKVLGTNVLIAGLRLDVATANAMIAAVAG